MFTRTMVTHLKFQQIKIPSTRLISLLQLKQHSQNC